MTTSVADVLALYARWGGDPYDEEVAQLDHALQTAALAAGAGAADSLVAAALLHDVGHLLDLQGAPPEPHERSGPGYLSQLFPPAVTDPIARHVDAKRYLCAVEPSYHSGLSAGSRRSLARQGGPYSAAEVAAFEATPGWQDAVALRRWDDAGKVDAAVVPGLDTYEELLWSLARSRVLTLNIWNLAGEWRARRQAIVAVVQRWAPDVVCLQEVVANDRGNQAEWLAGVLGGWSVAYAGEPHAGGPDLFGNAVLSRWPIDVTATCRLPHLPDDAEVQRVVVHARTGGVDVFSTHLSWQLHDAALRERQVQALVRFVDERTDPAAALGPVVAGDFNAEPDTTAIRYLCGLAALDGISTYLQDAWRLAGDGGPGLTWSNANPHAAVDCEPERRLDYVFSGFRGPSGVGRPLECRVVADEPVEGVWPSDHYGVLAVLAGPG